MANILIVEDERDLSSLIRRHLEGDSHRVEQVLDGASALPWLIRVPNLVYDQTCPLEARNGNG